MADDVVAAAETPNEPARRTGAGRRVAKWAVGIIAAVLLLIVGALVWRIADSRRTPLEANAPILPIGGADR